MFPAKFNGACHSLVNMMEVDIMHTSDSPKSFMSLCAKAEQIGQQVPVIDGSFSSLVKEPHIQPCLPETLTMDAIASSEKQVRTMATTVEDLEIHFSEACLKNYVFFDQCAGKKSLVCHPTLLNDRPLSVQSVANTTNELFTCLQDISDKAAENIVNTCPLTENTAWGARLLAYRESMEAAFTALERVKVNGFDCSGLKSGGHSHTKCLNLVEDIQNKCSGNSVSYDPGEGIESLLHEDTDDIDALLSSDEELSSTGHTISEQNVYNSSMPTDDGDDHSSSNPRKKRKFHKSELEEYADVDLVHSDADSSQNIMTNCEDKHMRSSHLVTPSKGPRISEVSFAKVNRFLCREQHLGKPYFHDRVGKYEQNTEFLDDIIVVKRAKIMKVKETFEELKNVIPGGYPLDDTVSVLEKAVQYIKSLQAKLQILEVKNEVQVNNLRGC